MPNQIVQYVTFEDLISKLNVQYFGSVVGRILKTLQIVFASDDLEHFAVRHHLLGVPLVAFERHVLDEANVDVFVTRELHKVVQLVVVQTAHDYGIQLKTLIRFC